MINKLKHLLFFLLLPGAASLPAAAPEDIQMIFLENNRVQLFCRGREMKFADCLTEQLRRHPARTAQDIMKQCCQASFGPEHLLREGERARRWFEHEFRNAAPPQQDEPLFELISPDICRVNIRVWKSLGLPSEWLYRMFAATAGLFSDQQQVFADCLAAVEKVLSGGKYPVSAAEWRQYLAGYRAAGSPDAVHHTRIYEEKERPSYRIINTRFLTALPVLQRCIETAQQHPERSKVIAIDGRAASGKTTLARQLALILDAGTVHMDDFFLPEELRRRERFAEAGGNVHYERFQSEVLPKLAAGGAFSYRRYDCHRKAYSGGVTVKDSPWRIVEGAYSLHPRFGRYADLTVFFDISPEEQLRRIRKRNGEAGAAVFAARWIPLEEKYISACRVRERADLIIGR